MLKLVMADIRYEKLFHKFLCYKSINITSHINILCCFLFLLFLFFSLFFSNNLFVGVMLVTTGDVTIFQLYHIIIMIMIYQFQRHIATASLQRITEIITPRSIKWLTTEMKCYFISFFVLYINKHHFTY